MLELRKLILSIPGKLASSISGKGLGKLPLITCFYGFFYYYLKPSGIFLIDVQGNKMYVDSRDVGIVPFLLEWGVYEKFETELLKNLLKEGMVFVDIGSNIGYYTLLAARNVGEKGKVFAFEPDPYNYSLLCRNIEVNGYRNIIPVQKAVFSKSGKMELFLDKNNLGAHSLLEANVDKDASVMIEATSLDDYFKKMDYNIDVIKLDAQGAEMMVLEGMENILNQNAALKLITEFWPLGIRNAGYSPAVFLDKIIGYGFKLYIIGKYLEPVSVNQILGMSDDNRVLSIFCMR